MDLPPSSLQPLPSFLPAAASSSSLAQRARSRRTLSLPHHTELLLPSYADRTASDSPLLLPASTSLSSASVASALLPPTFAVSIPLKAGPKRVSLTQPASPTWQSFISKARSGAAAAQYAADDAAITRSSISASLSSLQLPLSVHSIDIPESPLPPAELDHIQVAEAGRGAEPGATYGFHQQQHRSMRPPPQRRSPRAWLLLWLVTVPSVMLAVTCGLIFYHSLTLYASLYVAYLVFLPPNPLPISFQVLAILFVFAVIGRSLFNLLLTFARIRYRQLWVNQRRHRQLFAIRQLHFINCLMTAAALLGMPPALVTLLLSSGRPWSDPVVFVLVAIVALECVAWLATLAILAALRRDFTWKELSLHCPHVPISGTFNSTALQRRTVEQNRRIIDALPVHRFSLSQWREQQRRLASAGKADSGDDDEAVCCAICLVDMADGDVMRALKCSHCFHKRCIEQWLERKTCCPMCIRQIDVSLTRERDRQQKRRASQRTAEVVPVAASQVELAAMAERC